LNECSFVWRIIDIFHHGHTTMLRLPGLFSVHRQNGSLTQGSLTSMPDLGGPRLIASHSCLPKIACPSGATRHELQEFLPAGFRESSNSRISILRLLILLAAVYLSCLPTPNPLPLSFSSSFRRTGGRIIAMAPERRLLIEPECQGRWHCSIGQVFQPMTNSKSYIIRDSKIAAPNSSRMWEVYCEERSVRRGEMPFAILVPLISYLWLTRPQS
jgi:hypothetical protein